LLDVELFELAELVMRLVLSLALDRTGRTPASLNAPEDGWSYGLRRARIRKST